VTGVQTCALPISLSDLKSIIFANKTLPKERKNFARVCLEALLED
jgi:hypothetical protein